jgi:hypothetical protein
MSANESGGNTLPCLSMTEEASFLIHVELCCEHILCVRTQCISIYRIDLFHSVVITWISFVKFEQMILSARVTCTNEILDGSICSQLELRRLVYPEGGYSGAIPDTLESDELLARNIHITRVVRIKTDFLDPLHSHAIRPLCAHLDERRTKQDTSMCCNPCQSHTAMRVCGVPHLLHNNPRLYCTLSVVSKYSWTLQQHIRRSLCASVQTSPYTHTERE